MKRLILSLTLLVITQPGLSAEIEDAPLEWLIANTINTRITGHGHVEANDPLMKNIFKSINYDTKTDEIILTSNKKTFELRNKLVDYLKTKERPNAVDQKYFNWIAEEGAEYPVTLYKTNYREKGFYYINHVHTNISQDNSELKWLKLSPQKTFSIIESFLNRRNIEGAVALTDHDTDRAFDTLATTDQSRLKVLRSVEWGGSTHMCLTDIKPNWKNLPNGRKYSGEESIRQSRSSEGFRIINHPNQKEDNFPYTSWLDADGVEVWNSILENAPFMGIKIRPLNNRVAFKQWTDSLKVGKSHTAVSGTDFHFTIPCIRERSMVYPINFIPAQDKENTKSYLKNGRSSFTTTPKAPKLTLKARFKNQKQWSYMGDKLTGSGELEVNLYGDFSDVNRRIGGVCYNVIDKFYRMFTFWKKKTWEIRFYNLNGDVLAKRQINPKWYNYKKHFRAYFTLPVSSTDIVRAELWSISKKSKTVDLLGATNPIYLNWTSP